MYILPVKILICFVNMAKTTSMNGFNNPAACYFKFKLILDICRVFTPSTFLAPLIIYFVRI